MQRIGEIRAVSDGTNAFVVSDADAGQELFTVSFPGSIIHKYFQIESDYLLQFQCRSPVAKEKGNLLFISCDGLIKWWAERRRSDDCYVEVNIQDNRIIGYDGSYECVIDSATGRVLNREFRK